MDSMARPRKLPFKPRDLVAKDLRTPKYRMRVAVSKKIYNRKKIKHGHSEGFEV